MLLHQYHVSKEYLLNVAATYRRKTLHKEDSVLKPSFGLKSIAVVVFALVVSVASFSLHPLAQQEEPDYAKWSKIAIEKVKEKYPNGEVSDFLYVGRKTISENKVADTFLMVVKRYNEGKEVRVTVSFNPKTDKLIGTEIKELN
jgi:hypothetical protein